MTTKKDPVRDQAFRSIMNACKALGWQIAIPDVADDEPVPGLVCGTQEFMAIYTEDQSDDEIQVEVR